jgi:hypothetical protein
MQKLLIVIFFVFIVSKSFAQKLFNPDDVINNHQTEELIKKIIKIKDPNYKIEKQNFNGKWVYDITKKGNNQYVYSTMENSFSVDQFTHWANVDYRTVINFYKNCGYIMYKSKEIGAGNGCTRFKNKKGTIFVNIDKLTNNKCFIVISGIELDCESDV